MLLVVPAPARAQGFLDQFSYEGLRFSGVGFEVGVMASDRLETSASGALRIDYGLFAPRVRLVFGASYARGDFKQSEIARFEERVGDVVDDPTGDFTVEVGTISQIDVGAWADLQYLLVPGGRFMPFVGLGLGVHLRDGSGEAIAGTFVEDALDTVTAGLAAFVGFELAFNREVAFTADFRGELTSELRTLSARGGLMFHIPRAGGP